MALWAGLGYYSRARNLHACAIKIVVDYGGKFPQQTEDLTALPGIGKSTARAIAAFCFDNRESILDANVQRVLARTHGFQESIKSAVEINKLWHLADQLVPEDSAQMPKYTQALMDFGATVCKPTLPKCQSVHASTCIYVKDCWAYQNDQVQRIPLKIKKIPSKLVASEMLLLIHQDEILLTKRGNSGIWGGLWTLPETPWIEIDNVEKISMLEFQANQFMPMVEFIAAECYHSKEILAPRKHVFSHRTLYFVVKIIRLEKEKLICSSACKWIKTSDLPSIGLPTPIKKLLEDYEFLARI